METIGNGPDIRCSRDSNSCCSCLANGTKRSKSVPNKFGEPRTLVYEWVVKSKLGTGSAQCYTDRINVLYVVELHEAQAMEVRKDT